MSPLQVEVRSEHDGPGIDRLVGSENDEDEEGEGSGGGGGGRGRRAREVREVREVLPRAGRQREPHRSAAGLQEAQQEALQMRQKG